MRYVDCRPPSMGPPAVTCVYVCMCVCCWQSGAPEQVHALHQVVFGRQGRPHEFRRNLRQFSGFAFTADEAGYTKKRDSLLR